MRSAETVPQSVAVPRWVWGLLVLLVLVVYAVGYDQGFIMDAVLNKLSAPEWVHEFFHDGRHMLGFPCH